MFICCRDFRLSDTLVISLERSSTLSLGIVCTRSVATSHVLFSIQGEQQQLRPAVLQHLGGGDFSIHIDGMKITWRCEISFLFLLKITSECQSTLLLHSFWNKTLNLISGEEILRDPKISSQHSFWWVPASWAISATSNISWSLFGSQRTLAAPWLPKMASA